MLCSIIVVWKLLLHIEETSWYSFYRANISMNYPTGQNNINSSLPSATTNIPQYMIITVDKGHRCYFDMYAVDGDVRRSPKLESNYDRIAGGVIVRFIERSNH